MLRMRRKTVDLTVSVEGDVDHGCSSPLPLPLPRSTCVYEP